jgi:hypothetical protein
MKYTDIYVKAALPVILINFFMYLITLFIILINRYLKDSEVTRLKNLTAKDFKNAEKKVERSKFKRVMMKTFEFTELHLKWNGLIRANLLIYQKYTLGVFLNIAKGWNQGAKSVLKISYILSILGLLVIWGNGYVIYFIVERYAKKFKQIAPKDAISKSPQVAKTANMAKKSKDAG